MMVAARVRDQERRQLDVPVRLALQRPARTDNSDRTEQQHPGRRAGQWMHLPGRRLPRSALLFGVRVLRRRVVDDAGPGLDGRRLGRPTTLGQQLPQPGGVKVRPGLAAVALRPTGRGLTAVRVLTVSRRLLIAVRRYLSQVVQAHLSNQLAFWPVVQLIGQPQHLEDLLQRLLVELLRFDPQTDRVDHGQRRVVPVEPDHPLRDRFSAGDRGDRHPRQGPGELFERRADCR